MDVKKIALLVGALVIAAVTAIMAKNMFTGAGADKAAAAPVPQGPKVLVAKKSLPVGTIVDAESLTYQPWPKELIQSAYYLEGSPDADMSKLLGTVVRNPITAGEPITRGGLVSPGDRGFLAAALAPGMRAITVPVSAKTGVGGFVFPGDRVDMLLTQSVSNEAGDLKTTETILRNLRILATDSSTESETTPDGKTVVRGSRTVTLEVTPRIAEKISVAQTIGTLSLVLRSIADNQSDLERAIASGAVDVPDNASQEDEEKLLRQAMASPQDGTSTFVTGGDVSRFQRSSLPAPAAPVAAGAPAGGDAPAVPSGPVVRVTRGKATSVEAVAQGAGTLLDRQAQGMGSAGRVAPLGMSTLR